MTTQQRHNCQQELREADLKVTPARLGVLAALEHTNTPLDVNEVIDYLKQHTIQADKVTVFRIMNSLTQKGLIVPIQLNENKLRYEHATKADHHHFVCEQCGEIEDISDCSIGELEKEIQHKKGLVIKRHSLEFFGICKNCSN
jgi:Fur family ferric uptake transcriptional regulator